MTLDDVLDAPGAPGARLPRRLTLHDVAALLASDRAGAMTATITNISNGAIVD